MAFRIDFDAFGDKPVSRSMFRMGKKVTDLRPVFLIMSRYFYAMEKALFASEGASGGSPWEDLKDATRKRKAQLGQRPEKLRAEDVLMRSLTRSNARYSRRTMRTEELFLGTSDPKAIHHYFGAPAAGVPERRPIVFREVDKVAWVKMLQRYIITGESPVPTFPVF